MPTRQPGYSVQEPEPTVEPHPIKLPPYTAQDKLPTATPINPAMGTRPAPVPGTPQAPGAPQAPQAPGAPQDRFVAAALQQRQDQNGASGIPAASSAPGTDPAWLRSQQTDPNSVNMATTQPWQGGPNVTMTRAGVDGLPDLDSDYAEASRKAADDAYAGATQYMDEDFESDRASAEARLVNQGFMPGTEAFNRQMSLQQRGQNDARTQAAYMATQVGHQRAGDFLTRALQSRQTLMGERERDADRTFGQGATLAGLSLGARGQDMGVQQAAHAASGAAAAANASRDASRYNADIGRDLRLREIGMTQDQQDFTNMLSLLNASRGGVNMPNFGPAAPLDVGSAYGIASGNQNAAANRNASDRASLAGLGAAALGSYFSRP